MTKIQYFFFISSFILFTCAGIKAQDVGAPVATKQYQNSINMEAFGLGLGFAVNYERTFFQKKGYQFGASVGVSYSPLILSEFEFMHTLLINQRFGKSSHQLVIDAGMIFLVEATSSIHSIDKVVRLYSFSHLAGRIGWRYNFKKSNSYIGIHYCPMLELVYDREIYPSAYNIPFAYYSNNGGANFGWRF